MLTKKYTSLPELANNYYSMGKLLKKYGYMEYDGQTHILCPFHDDVNNPSARYYEDTDSLYCFTERRLYGAWDMLREVGVTTQKIADNIPYKIHKTSTPKRKEIDIDVLKNIRYNFACSGDINQTIDNILKGVGCNE